MKFTESEERSLDAWLQRELGALEVDDTGDMAFVVLNVLRKDQDRDALLNDCREELNLFLDERMSTKTRERK